MKKILFLLPFLFSLTTYAQPGNSHDFDFWIGDWEVYKYGTDTIVGYNSIQPIHGHQVLQENYHTPRGYQGSSTNIYNAQTGLWEQHWVDIGGYALNIFGGIEDGKMILSNCDSLNCNKVIWTPNSDGSVRQEWLTKQSGGDDWKKIFDGHYKKKKALNQEIKNVLPLLSEWPNIRDFTISSNQQEAYITVQDPLERVRVITRLTKYNGDWVTRSVASFSGTFKDIEPYLSPDNLQLYFASNRPLPNSTEDRKDYNIWMVSRDSINGKWSLPAPVKGEINTPEDEFYPAITTSGNLYFTSVRKDGKGKDDIYVSKRLANGSYEKGISLGKAINTSGYEFNSFIAPDESYLIFSGYKRIDGFGSGDLYISYRDEKGEWQKAKNLGKKFNSGYMDYCPFVLNGQLYFTSRRTIIETQTPLKTLSGLKNTIQQYTNGVSRIYSVPFK